MFKIAVIGATGYVGTEIIRLLVQHPNIEISAVVSKSFTGQSLSEIYPNFKNLFDKTLMDMDLDLLCEKADIFITALPHDASRDIIPELISRGKKVIDHSAAFRFKDKNVYETWYKTVHGMDDLLDRAVYGLPEIYRKKISDSVLVANPGCYPTCTILAIAPLLRNKLVHLSNIVIDAASGVTGAGRKSDLSYSFCEVNENFKAYGVTNHRHTPRLNRSCRLCGRRCYHILLSFNSNEEGYAVYQLFKFKR